MVRVYNTYTQTTKGGQTEQKDVYKEGTKDNHNKEGIRLCWRKKIRKRETKI